MTNAKKADEILTAAAQHMRDRAATYDKPGGERSMAQTVAIFNLYHGTSLTEAQGWHMMQILKDVRLFARPGYHADSAEDCTAYSALKAEAMMATSVQESEPVEKPAALDTDDDGWIDWSGGECPPVEADAEVWLKFRDGTSSYGQWKARNYSWRHHDNCDDIIKYRLSKP